MVMHSESKDVRCIVELDNGQQYCGWVRYWTFPNEHWAERDLCLIGDIWYKPASTDEWSEVSATHVLLSTKAIRMLELEHVERDVSQDPDVRVEEPN